MMRMWITAGQLGLKVHPMTAGLDHPETRAATMDLFEMAPGSSPVLCFRLGYGPSAPRSPRMAIADVAA